jgi:hypothetical protein
MAMVIQKRNRDAISSALAVEVARLRVAAVGSNFHACALHAPANLSTDPPTVTTLTAPANATDLPTSLVLCNWLIGVTRQHFADTAAHKVVDTADTLPAIGAAVDLTSAQTAANLIKASYETHRASTTYNYTADATNTLSSADATNQGTLNTLLNEMKTDLPAHFAGALAGFTVVLVDS